MIKLQLIMISIFPVFKINYFRRTNC